MLIMVLFNNKLAQQFLKFSFLLWFVLFTTNSFAQKTIEASNAFKIFEKLPYSTDESELTLDLYVPNNPVKPVPCIIVIQGGGFKSQDGQRFRYFAEYIAQNNYAAALISYRGQPNFTYETTMQDVQSAVRFIRKESTTYLIDSDKIGTTGRSAGATLAALLAVAGDNFVFDKTKHEVSCEIQAAVLYAGVFDFIARFADSSHVALQSNIDKKLVSNGAWIGAPFSKESKHWNNVSSINHLDKNDPPLFVMHCKDDKTVPWPQSRDFYEKINSLDNGSEVLYFEKGGHGFNLGDKELYLKPMMVFFKKQFE
jgi:acetyl esterase/lipase